MSDLNKGIRIGADVMLGISLILVGSISTINGGEWWTRQAMRAAVLAGGAAYVIVGMRTLRKAKTEVDDGA